MRHRETSGIQLNLIILWGPWLKFHVFLQEANCHGGGPTSINEPIPGFWDFYSVFLEPAVSLSSAKETWLLSLRKSFLPPVSSSQNSMYVPLDVFQLHLQVLPLLVFGSD